MKWITRARPKIDRIACPWLILRFIDKEAEFLFVAPADVLPQANATGAIPFDVEGVELSHVGPLCSFDALLTKYQLADPGLTDLARIVRGAAGWESVSEPRNPGAAAAAPPAGSE